jgi:hypothetical protein
MQETATVSEGAIARLPLAAYCCSPRRSLILSFALILATFLSFVISTFIHSLLGQLLGFGGFELFHHFLEFRLRVPIIALALPKHSMTLVSPFALSLFLGGRLDLIFPACSFSIPSGTTVGSLLSACSFSAALTLLFGEVLQMMLPFMSWLAAELTFQASLSSPRAT